MHNLQSISVVTDVQTLESFIQNVQRSD